MSGGTAIADLHLVRDDADGSTTEEPVQLDLLSAIAESDEGFDGWSVFDHPRTQP